MKSTKFSLTLSDFWKGLIVAVGTAIFPIITQSLDANQLTFNWKLIATTGIGAFLTYLAKNFFTDTTSQAVKTLEKQNVTVIDNNQTK